MACESTLRAAGDSPKAEAEVLGFLGLANNGYTYADSIPREYRAELAKLVGTGAVIRRTKRHPCRPRMTTDIYIIAAEYGAVTEAMRNPA